MAYQTATGSLLADGISETFRLNIATGTLSFMFKGTSQITRYLFGTVVLSIQNVSGNDVEIRMVHLGLARARQFTSATLFNNSWHLVTIVFSGQDITAAYVDGAAVTLGAASPSNTIATTELTAVGASQFPYIGSLNSVGTPTDPKTGAYAEFSVFNVAFNATEAAELYNSGTFLEANRHSRAANLTFYWTLRKTLANSIVATPATFNIGTTTKDVTHPIVQSYTEDDIEYGILWPDGTYMMFDDTTSNDEDFVARWAVSTYEAEVDSVLVIVQSISRTISVIVPVTSTLAITQTLDRQVGYGRRVRDTLAIAQTLSRNVALLVGVRHQIAISQPLTQGGVLPPQEVLSELSIGQIIVVETGLIERENVRHTIEITQIINTQVARTRTVSHSLDIVQGNGRPLLDGEVGIVEGQIAVEHAPAGVDLVDRPSILYDLADETFVTFEYPYNSPTHTLVIRAPLFGNREEIEAQRVQRYTLRNNLITFRDPDWFSVQVFRLKFDTLTEDEAADFLEFVSVSLGKPVKYTDHEGREWCVLIRNPNDSVTTRRDGCDKAVGLDLETINADDA